MLSKIFKKKPKYDINDPVVLYVKNLTESVKKTKNLNLPLEEAVFSVIDTETTGLDMEKDKLINIAAVKVKNFKIIDFYDTFINPEMKIPPESIKWHHITDDMVVDKPVISEVLPEFLKFIGDSTLVGHHVGFDIKMLNKDLRNYYGTELQNSWVDTMMVYARAIIKKDQHVTLDYLFDIYKVTCSGRHTALGDAIATAEVFNKMIAQAGQVFRSVKELCDAQKSFVNSSGGI
jgi:DNA polymerase III epsilon subunit family exonuclease